MKQIAFLMLALAACTPSNGAPSTDAAPSPAPAPPTTAAPVVVDPACATACAAMAAAGCSEGKSAACAAAMSRVESDRLFRTPSGSAVSCQACAGAKTPADVANLCASSCSP